MVDSGTPCRRADLRAPDVYGVEFAGDHHGREHAHAHVELTFETNVAADIHEVFSKRRTMKQHRERPLDRSTAFNDGVENAMVLGRHLLFTRNGFQSCHDLTSRLNVRSAHLEHELSAEMASLAHLMGRGGFR
jgi:hypothetical protein